MNNEYTPLLTRTNIPKYAFHTRSTIRRQKRIRQFQFCVCAILLFSITALILVAIANGFSHIFDSNNYNTTLQSENATNIVNEFNVLPDFDKKYTISNDDIEWDNAIAIGEKALKERDEIEERLKMLDENHPSYKHQKLFATSMKIRNMSRIGFSEQQAANYLRRQHNKFPACNRFNATYRDYCEYKPIICNPTELYRTFDGSCNNLKHPRAFGTALRPFRRILCPDYADKLGKPRKAKDGMELPSARTVSLKVHRPIYRNDATFSVMLAIWGQFLDHDISATVISTTKEGSPVPCCDAGSLSYPECFPIRLEIDDPFYIKHNISCLEFVRSAAAPTCCLGPREQLNAVSAYIDGSMIYGADFDSAINLRSFINGSLLAYLTEDNRTLLPMSKDLKDGCNREKEAAKGKYCFVTGDSRANENIYLTSMHLIWLRHHNYIASELAKVNLHWDDEKIYQVTRKILIAQIQHITYNEFLKSLLGNNLMEKHDLLINRKGYFHKYNDSLDASMSNAFSTAAFRFAHSLIPNLVKIFGENNSNYGYVELRKILLDPFKLYNQYGFDEAIMGALNTHVQANDPYFAPELKQHLFQFTATQKQEQNNRGACGLDLVTLNIQRGRDHGLPGYTIWLERCGMFRPRTMKQLAGVIDDESLNYISSIYSHPDDIDLYTGALSEKPVNDGMLGPTLTCIILDQFIRLKKGDRYWYENSFEPYAFTINQLTEIRKTLLASIICKNSDNIQLIQRYVMRSIDVDNDLINCSEIPQLNLSYWYDNSYGRVLLNENNFKIKIVN